MNPISLCIWTTALMLMLVSNSTAQDRPVLPQGLSEPPVTEGDPPALPPGLLQDDAPSLPEGPGDEPTPLDAFPSGIASSPSMPLNVTCYWELRGGLRTDNDPHEKQTPLLESRLQIAGDGQWERVVVKITADVIYDGVVARNRIQLNRGEGWIDLREANITFSPTHYMDVKAGRQVMTWGTGDLIFINDLFPKDWNSFFIGRDEEYLKAPSDAVKVSLFSSAANIDLYYIPVFDHDRYVDGRRVSYWNSSRNRRSGRNTIVRPLRNNRWFHDFEAGCRLYRNFSGYEIALYGYTGFWKSPAGVDRKNFRPTFPDLSVYGGSFRGRLFSGIANVELGYYDSDDDHSGNNPSVKNSEIRFLMGYDIELARDFTAVFQYYLEHMRHYAAYRRVLPKSTYPRHRNRHLITARFTKLLLNQNLSLCLFIYFCPTDSDVYVRTNITWKVSDSWSVETGGNSFYGRHPYTFFGQFEKNSNIYVGIRRYFTY